MTDLKPEIRTLKPDWNDAQRAAIEARGTNVLVAASAGTGKTAVLVERCLRLITDPTEPIDIDRLLVVTFTEAAAAEMRSRIGRVLRERIEREAQAANPAVHQLRRQLILLDRASISTIHAFALRTLQAHFYQVGLDPNCSVIDPEEADLVRAETLDEVFEALYTDEREAGERFRRLVGRYGRDGDDQAVRRTVLGLSDFLRSIPWPDVWRKRVLAGYGGNGERFEDSPLYCPFFEMLGEDLERLEGQAQAAARGAMAGGSLPPPYAQHLTGVAERFEALRERLAGDGYDALHRAMAGYKYPRLPTIKGIYETLRDTVKRCNDTLRNGLRKIRNTWCALSGEQWMATLSGTRPDVQMLFELVGRFDEAYARAKSERGEIDFQDLERYCFDLMLSEEAPPGALAPSKAARAIRDDFEAVLVDEYQDISPLQDAILWLCSRQDEPERRPNLFMVGDVKQSIYRFRLAEPEIFLSRLNCFTPNDSGSAAGESAIENPKSKIQNPKSEVGRRIDLTENFRSRTPLLGALNALFRLIMITEAGGIAYDASAELRGGFDYPPAAPDLPPPSTGTPVEVHFFDRSSSAASQDASESKAEAGDSEDAELPDELEQIEIEALWVAQRIRAMVTGDGGTGSEKGRRKTGRGDAHEPEFSVWDRGAGSYRPVAYRDVAVLLQTAAYKADVFVRVMRAMGVPAYTDAGSSCLQATEIQDMLCLLEVLDNPHQDIALAGVLRSPLVGLDEDDLARVRIHRRDGDFYAAAVAYAEKGRKSHLREHLAGFFEQMDRWRTLTRRGPLAQMLWTVYDETGYLDYVTAMDDGTQRRANLIGLYDRARQFDQFRRRGLSRFLEFIRRLQETEGDLGIPAALSEAEDVVRVMSVHKSKGLEFPVVIVPDIGKMFNLESARGDLVTDRRLGIALREVDMRRGIKYPTAAHLVVARRVQHETLAENMRLLYVATTRAREKLILCGSVRIDRVRQDWIIRGATGDAANVGYPNSDARKPEPDTANPKSEIQNSKLLPPLDPVAITSASCFADWVGPALARMGYVEPAKDGSSQTAVENSNARDGRLFAVNFHRSDEWKGIQLRRVARRGEERLLRDIAAMRPVAPPPHDSDAVAQLSQRLAWRYPWESLTGIRGKASVTELKRRLDAGNESDELARVSLAGATAKSPAFLTARQDAGPPLNAAQIGSAYHTVLCHLDAKHSTNALGIQWQIEELVARGLLSLAEAAAVEPEPIARLFRLPLGIEMRRRARHVHRELPFSLAVRVDEIERTIDGDLAAGEWVHVQGVIDCLIERAHGIAVVDFKTDRIEADEVPARAERYRMQLAFYARAVETIFDRPVVERTLFFLFPSVAYELGTREPG